MSTNKVYGDNPNLLPLRELNSRWEISKKHKYFSGISEDMSLDNSVHSFFGSFKMLCRFNCTRIWKKRWIKNCLF